MQEIRELNTQDLQALDDEAVINVQISAWCEQHGRENAFQSESDHESDHELETELETELESGAIITEEIGTELETELETGAITEEIGTEENTLTTIQQMPANREIPVSPNVNVGSMEVMSHFIFTLFVTSLKFGTPILTVDYFVSLKREKPMFTTKICKKLFRKNGDKQISCQQEQEEFSCIVGDPPVNTPNPPGGSTLC